jgi:hypothetical protein
MPDKAMKLLALVLAGTVGLILGCSPSESDRPDWRDARDSTGFRTLVESPSICHNCIVLEPAVVMGDTAGPGFLEWTENVTRDSLGHYWVGQRGLVKVFDSAGNFLRQVGRPGRGPMEFIGARPIYTDGDGRVHIFDPQNLRETIIGRDFELHEERQIPPPFQSFPVAVPLPGGKRYAVYMLLHVAGQIGLPLHIVEGSEVIHSFGASVQESWTQLSQFHSRRRLAVDRSGRVFSAQYYNYLIEAWTSSGERITGFEGPTLNEREVRPGRSPRDKAPSQIDAIYLDDEQLLWVASSHARDNWFDNMIEVVLPSGRTELRPIGESPRLLYAGRIDVIDLNSGSIIASSDREELITAFVGDGLGLEVQYTETDIPQLVVWRMTLELAQIDTETD